MIMPSKISPTTSLPPFGETVKIPVSSASANVPEPKFISPLQKLIAQQHFFAHLRDENHHLLSDLAMEVEYASDEWIFREGDPANRFFIILRGYVSIEVDCENGGTVPIRTLGPGDDLGWAWLFPPYYMHFSARATAPVRAIFFYGTRLREECEQDHELGYQLIKRVAEVLVQNLKATERRISIDYRSIDHLPKPECG
jgi:CRP/FNR family transcriptional regulator, cyclic AMP receptor protein